MVDRPPNIAPEGNAIMPGKTVLYAAVGPDITQYDIDVANGTLTARGTVGAPANVQYVWPHVSKKFLYVASTDSGSGMSGGGTNHRLALWDMYLVKDNHIRAARGLTNAIDRIQRTRRDLLLEVEVESMEQLQEALRPEVDRILIDNQPVDAVRRAIAEVDRWFKSNPPDHPRATAGARRWPEVEISGGINLETIRAYAETGPDWISVGALTHSAPALNLSLEIEEVG